jgi:TPR repeat protein
MHGDVMYQREECLVQASICREKAQADPARYGYWIDQAVVWLQRAAEARHKNAVTHEIHAGRMIPKRAH